MLFGSNKENSTWFLDCNNYNYQNFGKVGTE